jgi:hypothetical protein
MRKQSSYGKVDYSLPKKALSQCECDVSGLDHYAGSAGGPGNLVSTLLSALHAQARDVLRTIRHADAVSLDANDRFALAPAMRGHSISPEDAVYLRERFRY